MLGVIQHLFLNYNQKREKMRCSDHCSSLLVMLFFIANKVGPINVKTETYGFSFQRLLSQNHSQLHLFIKNLSNLLRRMNISYLSALFSFCITNTLRS